MTSPRRTAVSICIVVLAMNIILVSYVIAVLEQPTDTTKISSQARALRGAETTNRFLRAGGGIGGKVANAREVLTDKLIGIPSIKLGLKLALRKKEAPDKVLEGLRKYGVAMKEDYLVHWMRYVQKYRTKMEGVQWADDAYVIRTLKRFIPESQLSVVFKAMSKKTKLRSFGIELQNAATKTL